MLIVRRAVSKEAALFLGAIIFGIIMENVIPRNLKFYYNEKINHNT